MTDRHFDRSDAAPQRPAPAPAPWNADELGEDEVPPVVLYVVAGLLLISFTRYVIGGGGRSRFH